MAEVPVNIEPDSGFCSSPEVVQAIQKVIAELIGTYFLIFAGCCSVVLNNAEKTKGTVTFPGVCLVWGFSVTIMVYSLAHVSGAHFNPAVTITFALYRHFPLKLVPFYIIAQVLGSILASGTLYLLFEIDDNSYFGTKPAGTPIQSFIFEIITSCLLMFVVSAVSTDNRAIGKLGGIAVGMTITVDVFIAGPVSGASMNPARTFGPALVLHVYSGFWAYVVGPLVGALLGATCYNLIRYTDKPLREIGTSSKIFKIASSRPSFR
ncbi:hypothetical protein VNO78_34196 [Psophocarpus tetragonolobus]|uniref:Aquaporin NIP-type n=1 Tax=Psophocarpus tetragonolobus TaxID=3891 RepID=A0AAN9NV67_PSOTE